MSNIPWEWLRGNVGKARVKEYEECHQGTEWTSQGLLDYVEALMQLDTKERWEQCRRGNGDFEAQSAAGYAHEWELKYRRALDDGSIVAHPDSDADAFLKGAGLSEGTKTGLRRGMTQRTAYQTKRGETTDVVTTMILLYRKKTHYKNGGPRTVYAGDKAERLFIWSSDEAGSDAQGGGVSCVGKSGGDATQAGAAPGSEARAAGKGSGQAETATGSGVPERTEWSDRDQWKSRYVDTGWALEE